MCYLKFLMLHTINPNSKKQRQLLKLCLCARETKNVFSVAPCEHLPFVIAKGFKKLRAKKRPQYTVKKN